MKVRSLTHVGIPEPDLLASSRSKRQSRQAAALQYELQHREIQAAVQEFPDADILQMDAQTFRDLEIFASETAGNCLFDWCNYTRNIKGARVLQARMLRPISSPARIHEVQASISFLVANEDCFERLPSYVTTDLVEQYIHGILPLAMSTNPLEFFFAMLDIRFGDDLRYHKIMHGVESTSTLIRALRLITGQPELATAPGELGGILAEIRTLLAAPGFSMITERKVWDMRAWTILRIDQVFRIHEKHAVYRLVQLTYELDALLSMAIATSRHALVMPRLGDGSMAMTGEEILHPLVTDAVANPVALDQQQRLLFLTGPNMAGKTTYLRACGIALYLAHLGMGVPAKSFSFVPAERLFSSISLADNLSIGISFFRAEALRIKEIAKALSEGNRVVAIMDEPFKGTNVKDALDASVEVLLRFAEREGSLFMFSSHLIEMEERMHACSQAVCFHFEAKEGEGQLRFDYVLRPGVSHQRLGMRVLREEGIFELLDNQRMRTES